MFHKLFGSQKVSIILISVIFLPGTIIHEFAHAIMAKLLFVHVGKMELVPQLSGESLKLGSVEVGKTDIVRNFFIGIAPFLIGTSLLLGVLYYVFSRDLIGVNLITLFVLIFAFILSNTMYSSKKDMEGAIEFFLLIIVPVLILYFLGVRIPGLTWDTFNDQSLVTYFKTGSILLGIPIVLDVSLILFGKIAGSR